MLTLPTAFAAAIARGPLDVVHYVKIENAIGTIWEATTRPWLTYNASIAEVGSFSATFDPMDRKSKVGNFSVVSAPDGWLMDVSLNNRLKGSRITVKWGDMSAAFVSDLAPKFMGTIESALPDPEKNTVTLSCTDYLSTLLDNQVVGRWLNMHPLEIILQIMTESTTDGGLGIDASLINTSSFSPASHSEVRHFVVSRGTTSDIYTDTSVSSPQSAKQLIDELCELMDGQLTILEDGLIRFQRFNGAAAVDNWGDTDWLEVRLDEVDGNLRNRITMEFNQLDEAIGVNPGAKQITPMAMTMRLEDTDSSAAIASPGQTARIIDESYTTAWVEGDAIIFATLVDFQLDPAGIPATADVGDEFTLFSGMLHAFCGTRSPGFTTGLGNFEPTLKLDSSHKGYIRVTDEIIEVDRCIVNGDTVLHILESTGNLLVDMYNADQTALPGKATFRISARGAFGTPIQDHAGAPKDWDQNNYNTPGAIARDVTIPALFVQEKLRRYSKGAPKVTVRTTHHKYAYQLGDIITLTTDQIRYFGHASGVDTTVKWEICGKQDDIFGDEPCITWTLIWAYDGASLAIPPNKRISAGRRDDGTMKRRDELDTANNTQRVPRYFGIIPTRTGVNRFGTDEGIISTQNGGRRLNPLEVNVPANRTVYVDHNDLNNSIMTIETIPGTVRPRYAPGASPIATVNTDLTDITSVVDKRNTQSTLANDVVTSNANRGVQVNRSFTSTRKG